MYLNCSRSRQVLALSLIMFLSTGALAAGSPEAGKEKSVTCAACHGADGNSVNPEWPSLAGQHEQYLVKSLKDYQKGTRSNVLMTAQAANLSEQDMLDLAAYYASQTAVRRTADPDLVAAGERLYRGGDIEKGISACIACHGPTGLGNPTAAYPVVSGQHAAYSANQLRLYASGERKSDPQQMMRNIASLLSEDDIKAVSSYVQGLY